MTRAFVWICYVVHQCAIWGIIYKAQLEHRNDVQYHTGLRWYNIWSFAVNLSAHLLHLIQTHLTYDATAQDVTESSSQGSVIMLIVMIMMIEYKHRGIFVGWPAAPDNDKTGKCSWRLPTRPMELVRKYHGYAFSWATIYTFWYHPMEPPHGGTSGTSARLDSSVRIQRCWRGRRCRRDAAMKFGRRYGEIISSLILLLMTNDNDDAMSDYNDEEQ